MEQQLNAYQARKRKSERFITIGGITLILAVVSFILEFSFILGAILGIIGVISMIVGVGSYSKLTYDFKHDFLVKLMGELIEEGNYDPKRGLDRIQVYATEFLKKADRFHTEDLITGKIDGVQFVSSDVKLEEKRVRHTKQGTQTYYEVFFLGRVFIFEFNKDFEGYLQCLEQGQPTVNRRYQKIKLESIDFNKKFTTFASNPHSAFYVLTPHFMESMLIFEKNNPGRLNFSFIDSKLYVGINNNKDTFSLIIYRKIDERLIESFKRDIKVIFDLIDDLKLNNDIFKK